MAESKKSKKHGRNKNFCKAYALDQRAERSKARKLFRHLFAGHKHLTDHAAVHAWNNLSTLARQREKFPIQNITPIRNARHFGKPPAYKGHAMGGRSIAPQKVDTKTQSVV